MTPSLSGPRTAAARVVARPLQWSEAAGWSGIEVSRLSRYLVVVAAVGGLALLSVWSRIDYRKTALALDATETAYQEAMAEHARLDLESAALRDPARLAAASAALSLAPTVRVVDLATAHRTASPPQP